MFPDPKQLAEKPKAFIKDLNDRAFRIASKAQQPTLGEAMLADALDLVPLIGDGFNAARIADAQKIQDKAKRQRHVTLQAVDFAVGMIPGVGDIADLFFPICTANYIADRLPDPLDLLDKIPKPQDLLKKLPNPKQFLPKFKKR